MKNEFRKFCKKGVKNRYYYSKIIQKELYKELKKYKKILLYLPLKNEVDITDLIKKLKRSKKEVYVPFMEDLSFKMVKFSLPLEKKRFSILEPKNKQKIKTKIDVALIPVIGVDKECRRVGFGKGMYDRAFFALKYRVTKIFVQLRPCIAKNRVTDNYDLKGDIYISFKIRRDNGVCNRFSAFDIIRSRGILFCKKNG